LWKSVVRGERVRPAESFVDRGGGGKEVLKDWRRLEGSKERED